MSAEQSLGEQWAQRQHLEARDAMKPLQRKKYQEAYDWAVANGKHRDAAEFGVHHATEHLKDKWIPEESYEDWETR